jgi:hypothetical protein
MSRYENIRIRKDTSYYTAIFDIYDEGIFKSSFECEGIVLYKNGLFFSKDHVQLNRFGRLQFLFDHIEHQIYKQYLTTDI